MHQICAKCDGLIEDKFAHNCIRGITENINRLHSNLDLLMEKKLDHLDGLKFALEIIQQVQNNYEAMGYTYNHYQQDPFNDISNAIRMRLRIKLIPRKRK